MAVVDDLADFYNLVEQVEDVIVTPTTPPATAQTGVKARKRQLSRSEVFFGQQAGISPNDAVFHLWVSTLGTIVPNPGDKITRTNGEVWQILSLQLVSLETRWRCVCRKNR